jgi:hypothetical protein
MSPSAASPLVFRRRSICQRDLAYLVRLHLVDENEGRVKLTDLGRERYQGLSNGGAMSDVKDEVTAVLRRHLDARDD